jgi:hypothetical protein
MANKGFTRDPEADEPVTIPRPRVDVLERAVADPFGAPSSPVELKDPALVTHWCNTELKGGAQLHSYTEAGWLKVRPEYLKQPDHLTFSVSPDGYVTRGERHREILMYTTAEHNKRRMWAKTESNMKRMRQSNDEIAQSAAQHFGSEAGDFLSAHGRGIGGIKDSREVIATEQPK